MARPRRWFHPRWTDFLGLLGAAGFALLLYRDSDSLVGMGGSLLLATYPTIAPRVRDEIVARFDPRRKVVPRDE